MNPSLNHRPGMRIFLCLLVVALVVTALQQVPTDQVIEIVDCFKYPENPMCLKNSGNEVIGLVTSLLELITSFGFALIAAGGLIVMKRREWIQAWSFAESLFAVGLFLCAIVSLGGAYLGYVALIGPAAIGYVVPFGEQLQWALEIAFYGLILSVVFLGAIVLKGLGD